MRPPEEVAKDIIRTASISSAAAIIAADRKEAVAEFVREAICVECAQCASDGPDHESIYEFDGCWYHDCGGTAWVCKAGKIRALAREKGIDL